MFRAVCIRDPVKVKQPDSSENESTSALAKESAKKNRQQRKCEMCNETEQKEKSLETHLAGKASLACLRRF